MTATETRSGVRPDPDDPRGDEVDKQPSPGPTATAGTPADAAASSDSTTLGATEALPRLLKYVGAVVAPATLATALLLQFGRLGSAGYFRYFGVNFTVLDLGTNEFLQTGADGLWVPAAGAGVLALLAIWTNRLLLSRLPAEGRSRTVHVLIPVLGVVGAVLMTLALLDLAFGVRPFWGDSEAGGLSLAFGTVLLVYAIRLVRLTPPPGKQPRRDDPAIRRRAEAAGLAEWGAAFLLVSIGLYWAAGQYAFGVGTGRALELRAALPSQPAAVLYSQHSLSIDVPGVTGVRCKDPDAAYHFRYDGLRLVRQSGGQYLLLPATWTRETGSALLIPRSDAVRLEFRTATTPEGPC